jgi:magnesium chelatase family protein
MKNRTEKHSMVMYYNIVMIGSPGSGKTMLARRMPSILPPLSFPEALEVTKIYSVAGLLPDKKALLTLRPFRSPHHTISNAGLIGGGRIPRPGEVSLAHNGILFLDELPEFQKNVLEVLRQPLEDGFVTIARAQATLAYPANLMLVAALNPCPCGFFGDPDRDCSCTGPQIQRYLHKISGPLLDRIDIHIEVPRTNIKDLESERTSESSSVIKERVRKARTLQQQRFEQEGIFRNAQMQSKHLKKYCKINTEAKQLMRDAFERLGLSARAHDRILKVARTIADLAGEEYILVNHIAEAIQYRSLDRKLWA